MDIQSILGYSRNSPYRGNPYLDINSPNGLIDMSNTDIDLIGIDNLGNKKKMKAGRKKAYKFTGTTIREIPMQQGGVPTFATDKAAADYTNQGRQWLRGKLGTDNWLANNTTFGGKGDPIPQYEYPQGMPQTTPVQRATSLPFGVTADMVMNTQQGYGYLHPQNGNWVPVDPTVIYAASNKKPAQPSYAKAFKQGGTNPYMQKGGYSAMDLYKYLFSDSDENDYSDNEKEESPHTAPSEEELGIDNQQLPPEPDDYEMALQMAMAQDNYETVTGDGGSGSLTESYFTPKVVGVNPYQAAPAQNISNPSKYAYDFFQKKGLPSHVAAGIVGNLMQESGNFRPDVVTDEIKGDSGMSHGIAQWQKERWPAYKKWASSNGKDPNTLDSQLEYVYVEANQRGDLQKTLTAQTPEEAARIFAKHYERPAYIDNNRAVNARQLYQQK